MKQDELLLSFSKLSESQQNRIEKEILDFLKMNLELKNTMPVICPCCGKKERFIKKGVQGKLKKQRYECKSCHHRFTYDSKTITSCLKISEDDFIEICEDTIHLVPMKETSARLNLSENTVFLNRHKFLCMLKKHLDESMNKASGTIELDETYLLESSKGKTPENRKARHRGEPSRLRGISHEQVCIVTTTDRNEHEIFKAVGFGKPTSTIITENFKDKIEERSMLYVDGTSVYDKLASESKCNIKHLKGYNSYNRVEHLNTVNSIHSTIKQIITKYRGISTKYINRYNSLFVLIRKYIDVYDNELSEKLIMDYRFFPIIVRRNTIKSLFVFN